MSRARKSPPGPLLFIHGNRIPNVIKNKFLGLTFDQKLTWSAHVDTVVSSCLQKRNIFILLTNQKFGPNIHTLTTLFKSIVRSKVDYGAIAYGGTSSTNIAKIDIVCRGILRMILGAFKSTPVDIIYADLGLEPFKKRCQWLKARYLIKLSKNPTNSTYQPAYHHIKNPKEWPPRSIPNISPMLSELAALDPNLFKTLPDYFAQRKIPPPWSSAPHKTSYFPMSKKFAQVNQSEARAKMSHALKHLPHTTIKGYTDGSVSSLSTSCAYTFPEIKEQGAWYLTPGSNILTAELHGIFKALETCYHLDPGPTQVQIFTDSQSALMAIESATTHSHNPIIHDIWNLLHCLKNAGTYTHLTWIPSHIGIPGNEDADRLASNLADIPCTNKINNTLTASELIEKYKRKWLAETLTELKHSDKTCLNSRDRLGVLEWHHHPIRNISITLHRLRSGHNKLNYFLSKLDMDVSPLCRHGCLELEDTKHVLTTCKLYYNLHAPIKQFFMENKLTWDVNTLIGLNMSLDKSKQLQIRDVLVSFLWKSKLHLII
ncbi:uncharacterized protein LOC123471039 [Daphnia magna]|uniref:uncharacterized protein LOC123471039 n=1 Tax=Daphnia magna TaxID=35525 RepID=UPI001E1BAC82|nr:uncharacterized protein LOC123471039 [Daphnia magna]